MASSGYLYPSDDAAALDWDAFAIYGVQQVRAAADAGRLAATLNALFGPLGPGIQVASALPSAPAPGQPDPKLIAWRYLGVGITNPGMAGPYRAKRTNRTPLDAAGIDGFVTVMQTVPALPLRGKTIRLRGHVRATARDRTGGAALWLRVDRPDQQMGFFDNMGDRSVRDPNWREYTIEGPVADDATNIAMGAMASGAVTADFDNIDLAVRGADGAWSALEIKDGGFESTSGGAVGGWMRAGTSKNALIDRPAVDAPEGRQFSAFLSAPTGTRRARVVRERGTARRSAQRRRPRDGLAYPSASCPVRG